MQKIVPTLWLDHQAEEAAAFYTAIFKHATIGNVTRYGREGFEIHGMKEGTVLTIDIEIEGQEFVLLNGGPLFKFNESVSFMIYCKDQKEIDYYWEKLSADPKAEQCGWLKDQYGLSWQIVPEAMKEMMQEKDPVKFDRLMSEILRMKKPDLSRLESV